MFFTVPGKPMPLQRPRAGKRGFYDPQYIAKKNFAFEITSAIKAMNIMCCPLDEPISIKLIYFFKMPKSWSKKKKERMFKKPHTVIPDLDNLIKQPCDSLKGILWSDDRLIYKIDASKYWHNESMTCIEIIR